MEKRLFGKTDMRVSVLGFGSYKMSGKPGGCTLQEVDRLLGSILDIGVNVIDTPHCAEGLTEKRISSKVKKKSGRAKKCLKKWSTKQSV